ncbi:hypothetical protein [Streptomyces sp. NBC_00102]|uniref:hypothetical protein n=1 Tax=Streptomyces sp. NBC_00102 TaxID=2975652 RepID=UPI002256AADE|nr:hypothetical protein [Streptomyces sp. NBC_00102]MCX5399675.1 hypothetical protein [Streptomyces sp. NBC_00102]
MSDDVKNLLERAAADAGRPVLSTEAVWAGAARVRFRRRAAVSCAALAVVAAGAVAVPQLAGADGSTASLDRVSVAASADAAGTDKASRVAALLPAGVGKLEEVSFVVLIKHVKPSEDTRHFLGPLDGDYAVRKDGGVGYLSFEFRSAKEIAAKSGNEVPAADQDLCEPNGKEPERADCVREVLPDGRVLTTWSDPMDYGDGTPQWGPEIDGQLILKDGSALMLRSSTGFEAKGAQGPLLKAPPLNATQVRGLMLRPELLPEK